MKFRLVAKTVLIMKFTAVLILAACMQVAAKGYGQGNISLHAKNASILSVVKEIARQAGYKYILNEQWAGKMKPVSIDTSNITVEAALDKCFEGQPYTYTIVNRTIIVRERALGDNSHYPMPEKLVKAQGVVYNEAGQPLSGANVTIKETGKGTITNAKGEFDFLVPSTSALVISFIGYTSQIVKVTTGTVIQVYLTVAKNELDKVVVQAYGTTTQRLATGNIGTVRAEEIARQPVMNVLDVLQGQVPGAIVTNTGGYASGQIKVEIRGRNTINPNFPSDPLYIIDGVPLTILDVSGNASYSAGAPGFIQSGLDSYAGGQSPLFSLDPNNIESLQVLKDGDATAIYGSRGANGVILITTKKGTPGKSKLELNVSQGETFITRKLAMANTQQYIAMRKEALANDGFPINISNSPDLIFGDSTRYTDWQKIVAGRLGSSTSIGASFSGGNITTTYRMTGSYDFARDMTAKSGGNNRGSFLLNLNHKSQDQRLSLGLSANYSYASINQISTPVAPNMAPNAPPIYDKLGNINYSDWDHFYGTPNSNHFGILLQPYQSNTTFLTANFQLNYEIIKGLIFRTSLGYNEAQNSQHNYLPIASLDPARGTRYAGNNIGSSENKNIIIEPTLEYSAYWKAGKISILAGATGQRTNTNGTLLQGSAITDDALIQQINAAPVKNFNYSAAEYKYAGVFGRINYNLYDKYIVNLNVRRDGSSHFGPGKQYGNFGSVGAAWLFSEEHWVKKNLPFLSFGKIRGSYGITGGDQIGDYQYLTQWIFAPFPYNGFLPLNPIKHTDSLFHWQQNRKVEVALDLNLFKDRIALSIARYSDRTNNQLVPFPTPGFTGFSSVLTNSPADVENSGWEFTLRSKIVDVKNFRFSAIFNIGINRNRLVSYPNLAQSPFNGIFFIGKSLSIRRLLHCTGVDPQTGLYTFEDRNKDGQITYDFSGTTVDDSYTVDITPKFDGSLTLQLNYKRWALTSLFYFRKQLGRKAALSLDIPGDASNQPLDVIEHQWQRPGQIAEYAKFTTNPTDNSWFYYKVSDELITDASFIRMQNLALYYSVPGKHWQLKGIHEIKLDIRAQNVFVITKYKGTDPEIQNFGQLPLPRIITAGFSLIF